MMLLRRTLLWGLLLSGAGAWAQDDCARSLGGASRVQLAWQGPELALRYELPEPVTCLRFKAGGALRRATWQLQGPGQLAESGDFIRWEQPVRSFDVRVAVSRLKDGQFDRVYTPVMPLADGRSVAVYTDYLLLAPATGPTRIEFEGLPARAGLKTVGPQVLNSDEPPGYVLLGSPVVERFGDDALIIDQSLPAPLLRQVRQLMDEARQRLAPVPRPGGPVTILAMGGRREGDPSWRGDVSAGLIRLGFYGAGWGDDNPALARLLSAYVLHERFHLHNMGLRPQEPAGVFLLEGGADAVAFGLQHESALLDDAAYLARQNEALRQCLLSEGGTLAEKAAQGGRVPYDCGLVLVAMASWAVAGTVLDGHIPLALWQDTLTQVGAAPYGWRDFLAAARRRAPAGRQAALDLLEQLTQSRITLSAALASPVLQGFASIRSPADATDAAVSAGYAGWAMMKLLQSNCTGQFGFFENPGSLTLDTANASCRDRWPHQRRVTHLNGHDIGRDGYQAARSVAASCAADGTVRLAASGHDGALVLPCRALGDVPAPYALLGSPVTRQP